MSTGTRVVRGTRLALGLKLFLALYVLAAAALPLGHHDVVCHAKTPTHCTTCVASSGAVVGYSDTLAGLGLNDLGLAPSGASQAVSAQVSLSRAGRAPPSSGSTLRTVSL